jgi:hypothetical protein
MAVKSTAGCSFDDAAFRGGPAQAEASIDADDITKRRRDEDSVSTVLVIAVALLTTLLPL